MTIAWLMCKLLRNHKWAKWSGSSGQMNEGFVFTCKRCGIVGTA